MVTTQLYFARYFWRFRFISGVVGLHPRTILIHTVDTYHRFNLGTMQSQLSSNQSSHIINTIHAILKPFLLRRLKDDVETSLPPKKEYVLYAPLSERQKEIYNRIVTGTLRAYLIGDEKNKSNAKKAQVDINAPRKSRSFGKGKRRKRYDVDGDDDEYFDKLEKGELVDQHVKKDAILREIGGNHQYKTTRKLSRFS